MSNPPCWLLSTKTRLCWNMQANVTVLPKEVSKGYNHFKRRRATDLQLLLDWMASKSIGAKEEIKKVRSGSQALQLKTSWTQDWLVWSRLAPSHLRRACCGGRQVLCTALCRNDPSQLSLHSHSLQTTGAQLWQAAVHSIGTWSEVHI